MIAILATLLWFVAAWLFWTGMNGGNDFHLMSAITVFAIGVIAYGQAAQLHLLGQIERHVRPRPAAAPRPVADTTALPRDDDSEADRLAKAQL